MDIKKPVRNDVMLTARIPKAIATQIKIIARQHKVDKSIVVRSLLEEGLRHIKT